LPLRGKIARGGFKVLIVSAVSQYVGRFDTLENARASVAACPDWWKIYDETRGRVESENGDQLAVESSN